MNDTKQIVTLLKNHGLKATVARIKIMHYLMEHDNHPSVEQIYDALKDEIPTLSKATVYNTLHSLSEKGVLRELHLGDSMRHFDVPLNDHAHFVCLKCHKIYDIDYVQSDQTKKELADFDIQKSEVIFQGICKECKNQ